MNLSRLFFIGIAILIGFSLRRAYRDKKVSYGHFFGKRFYFEAVKQPRRFWFMMAGHVLIMVQCVAWAISEPAFPPA